MGQAMISQQSMEMDLDLDRIGSVMVELLSEMKNKTTTIS